MILPFLEDNFERSLNLRLKSQVPKTVSEHIISEGNDEQ